jgi:hypothetical protein
MTPATIILILLGSLAPAAQIREQDGIELRTDVASNLYTWSVKNLSADPITSFAIEVYHTYDFHAPGNWELEGPMPEGAFRAWITDARHAILPGQSAEFSARFTSRGAMIGTGPATIGLHDGRTVTIPGVWRPVPESTRSVYLIPATIGLLALLHTIGGDILARKRPANAA